MIDKRDAMILALCEHLHICSRLLTCAAERLGWDRDEVQELVRQLRVSIEGCADASSKSQE